MEATTQTEDVMLLDERASVTDTWATDEVDITVRRFAVRRRILAVAKHRFARFGYDRISLQDLAVSAGVGRDELLGHFRDKELLFAAILDEGWKELLPRLREVAARSITAHSAMLGIFALMANTLQKDEDFIRLLLVEGRRPGPLDGELGFTIGYRRFLNLCRELVAIGQRDGSFRPNLHPQVAASMLVGALEGMLRDRLVAEQERSVTPYNGSYLMSAFDALVAALT